MANPVSNGMVIDIKNSSIKHSAADIREGLMLISKTELNTNAPKTCLYTHFPCICMFDLARIMLQPNYIFKRYNSVGMKITFQSRVKTALFIWRMCSPGCIRRINQPVCPTIVLCGIGVFSPAICLKRTHRTLWTRNIPLYVANLLYGG